MADTLTTNLTNLMYEMRERAVRVFPTRAVFLSELEGVNKDAEPVYNGRGRVRKDTPEGRKIFSGKWARVPLRLNPKQGTGTIAEAGTVNTPHVVNTNEAHIPITRIVHPISISLDAAYASEDNYAETAGAVADEMKEAEDVMPRVENEMLQGNGDALLAAVTAGLATAVVTVGTAANFYQLYAGRIIDVLTRATGTPVTNGAGRTIVDTNPTAGTITVDLAITTTTAEGVYIEGSYGTAIQGLGQVIAQTGQFEGIDKALVPQWRGVDGRSGVVTAADLSMALLDAAEDTVGNNGGGPDFYLGDPRVISRYHQTLITQVRWAGEAGVLKTGWSGITYRDKVLVADRDSKPGRIIGLDMDAYQLYSYTNGPDWIDDTGSMWMRFSRKLPREAWFADFFQFGVKKTNTTVFLDNLNRA
jgi:hypothetical protein